MRGDHTQCFRTCNLLNISVLASFSRKILHVEFSAVQLYFSQSYLYFTTSWSERLNKSGWRAPKITPHESKSSVLDHYCQLLLLLRFLFSVLSRNAQIGEICSRSAEWLLDIQDCYHLSEWFDCVKLDYIESVCQHSRGYVADRCKYNLICSFELQRGNPGYCSPLF